MLKTLYALALAVLLAAFVGFGIETFYPAPESPEEAALSQEGPPPTPGPSPGDTDVPPGVEPSPGGPGGPGFEGRVGTYEQQLADHDRVASAIAIAVAVLILVAGLVFGFSRLPIINDGVTLGGLLILIYGLVLAIQAPTGLLGFIVVAVALIVLLAFLYRQSRRIGRSADPDRTASS